MHVTNLGKPVLHRFKLLRHLCPILCEGEAGGRPMGSEQRSVMSLAPMLILAEVGKYLRNQHGISTRQQRAQQMLDDMQGRSRRMLTEEEVIGMPIAGEQLVAALPIE